MRKVDSIKGAITLVTVIIVAAIVLLIATTGVIISTILINSAFSERLASEALFAARAGAQDAALRIVRNKCVDFCPSAPGGYSVAVGERSAQVTVSAISAGLVTVESLGSAGLVRKKIVTELSIDELTGEVRARSFKEIPL